MTYRQLVAHEREFASVEIVREEIDVEIAPERAAAVIRARVSLANRGEQALDGIRLLLAEEALLRSVRDDRGELEHEDEVFHLRSLAARTVEVELREPLAPAGTCRIVLDYEFRPPPTGDDARLAPDDGYLRIESLWAPMLHTPLSKGGLDRPALALRVTLPDGLVPIALPELSCTERSGGRATYAGESEFRFSPFLAYGRYERHDSPRAEVWLFEGDGAEPAEFLLDAAGELRATFEALLGAPPLARPRIAAVKMSGSSWGAPYCLLIDDSVVPRKAWQQAATFGTVAHEFAHTWFGCSVAPHGQLGYLHESLAQQLSALAVGARYGAASEEDAYETWLIQYARGSEPLSSGLGELSMLDRAEYVRGAYLVGPQFLHALESRLGRETWHAILGDFARRYAGSAADLDDLCAVVRAHAGDAADDLFDDWLESTRAGDELYERGRALIAAREGYWRAREARPDAALRVEVNAKLDEAVALLRTADLTGVEPAERAARAGALLRELHYEHDVQTTVLARDGTAVFHVAGITGSLLGHRDVRGRAVYADILATPAGHGEIANFDFCPGTLETARENAIAFARLDGLDWTVVVEGHGWRSME